MITAVVKQCTCQNEGQDDLYGKSNRVHNLTAKSSSKKGEAGEYRCTVCDSKSKHINQ
jgi:hypothetical protein